MSTTYLTEFKISARLALPMIAAFLAEMGMQLTNSVMMGYLGPQALAAGALAVSASILIIVATLGFTAGVGVFMAQAHGSKDRASLARYWQQGLYICIAISIPVMLLYANFGVIFRLFHQDLAVTQLAQHYLWGELGCAFPVFGFCLYKDLGAILEKTNFIMFVALCALPLNTLLAYLFIFGKWGFPRWGMFGIGLSGTIVYWLMFIAPLIYARFQPAFRAIIVTPWQPIHWETIRDIFHLGWPLCCVYFFEAALFFASAIMMGWVNVDAQAAHQIVIQTVDLAFMLALGVAQVAGLRIAIYFGARDVLSMKHGVGANVLLTLIISLSCTAIFLLFPEQLAKLFLKSSIHDYPDIIHYTKQFFIIAACFVCFDALKLLANNILRGLEDTFIPMLLGLSSYWIVGILTAYFLAFVLHWEGTGIWCGLALGIFTSAVVLWWRWFYQYRKLTRSRSVSSSR